MTTDTREALRQKFFTVCRRMALLRNCSRTCDLSDCRRERKCVGTYAPCMWTLKRGTFTLPADEAEEWRDCMRQRRALIAAMQRQRCDN